MRLPFLVAFVLGSVVAANAATITALTQLAADVQTAINKAANGDTVVVPAGVVNWDLTGITIPSTKAITLDGTGVTVVRGFSTSTFIVIATSTTAMTRITGFTFNETTNGSDIIDIGGGFTNARFRVDHCTFYSTAGQSIFIRVFNSWGLIDHCTFSGDDASEMVHNQAYGDGVTTGWGEVITPGSPDAVYIEDCTFSKTDQTDPYFWGTSALQSYYGARTVIRHNTFNYCQVDQHGTAGVIGARWWEIYENDFYCPAGSGQSNWMAIRAGSGVIYNNRMHQGSGSITPSVELYEEDTGYPASYQIGRGKSSNAAAPFDTNQVLDPAYCWNNTGGGSTPGSGSSNVVDGRDFYSNTQKPGYTAYTYPNPLASTVVVLPTLPAITVTPQ